MTNTAILFLIYNRPDLTRKVFEIIRSIQPKKLYISADGPKHNNEHDFINCNAARAITEKIDWPCEISRLYRKQNLGCGIAVSESIKWFFSEESEGIILEDDCLPHKDFFVFAEVMLERFRNDNRIISISGSNLGYETTNPNSFFFSRFMNMWGWATWKNRSDQIDYSLFKWKKCRSKNFWTYRYLRQNILDTDFNWYKIWKNKFDKVANDPSYTWDWQWIYHQLKNHQYTIIPTVNLVENMGFNICGTHTLESNNPAANIPTRPLQKPLKYNSTVKPDLLFEENNIKWTWCYHKRLPTVFYIKKFISTILRNHE